MHVWLFMLYLYLSLIKSFTTKKSDMVVVIDQSNTDLISGSSLRLINFTGVNRTWEMSLSLKKWPYRTSEHCLPGLHILNDQRPVCWVLNHDWISEERQHSFMFYEMSMTHLGSPENVMLSRVSRSMVVLPLSTDQDTVVA